MNIRQSDNQVHYENDSLEVGYMTYLNSEVFYRKLPPDSCRLHRMHPRDMALAVEQGDIHAGPLPVAEVMRLNGTVRSLGDLGVACDGAAMSVFVFSHYPIKELSGKRIAVTSHTATSIQLLRVLLADLWDVAGHEFVTMSDTYDAALVIGDPALELLHQGGFRHHYDLGTAWKNLTGLPFVFAEWVIRSDVRPARANEFADQLLSATHAGLNSIPEIQAARSDEVMTSSEIAKYVRNFTYFIGEPERAGQQEFKRRLGQLQDWRPTMHKPISAM